VELCSLVIGSVGIILEIKPFHGDVALTQRQLQIVL